VEQPRITELPAIIDYVRLRGSVHYPLGSVPGEFGEWRLRLRRLARAGGVRISVLRTSKYVIVENRDYECV